MVFIHEFTEIFGTVKEKYSVRKIMNLEEKKKQCEENYFMMNFSYTLNV